MEPKARLAHAAVRSVAVGARRASPSRITKFNVDSVSIGSAPHNIADPEAVPDVQHYQSPYGMIFAAAMYDRCCDCFRSSWAAYQSGLYFDRTTFVEYARRVCDVSLI